MSLAFITSTSCGSSTIKPTPCSHKVSVGEATLTNDLKLFAVSPDHSQTS
jgi:hypothetical protein